MEFIERKVVKLGEDYMNMEFPDQESEAFILLTFDGRKSEIENSIEGLKKVALKSGAVNIIELSDKETSANVWKVRGALVKAVEAVSEQEPLDIVVPINQVDKFVGFVNDLENKSGMSMIAFGHAGDGNVHLCVVRGDRDDDTWDKELRDNLTRLYKKAHELGGLVSGEHGIGLSKQRYLVETTSGVNISLMRNIKNAFDAKHILNAGISYDVECSF